MKREEIGELWNFSNPQQSEAKFKKAISEETDEIVIAELQTQLARSLGLQQKFAEAMQLLSQIETQDARVLAMIPLEMGRCLNSSGNKIDAKKLFQESYDLSEKHGIEDIAIDALHMIAIVSPAHEALEINLQAIKKAENSEDKRARNWLGSLLNNTAWSLHDLKQYDEALQLFIKAKQFREEMKQVEQTRIATWCIARCYRSLNRIDDALKTLKELENQKQDGYVFEELGECLLLKNRKAEAAPYFIKAFELLSNDAYLQKNEPNRLARIKKLAAD